MTVFLNVNSQTIRNKTIHKEFTSRDLIRGGEYSIIASNLGELKIITDVVIYLKSSGIPYSIANADSVLIKVKDFSNTDIKSFYISDSLFTRTNSFGTAVSGSLPKSSTGNYYTLTIPNNKFSGSTSTLTITLFYKEIKY